MSMHFSFRGKIFFLFIFYGLILALSGQFIISFLDKRSIQNEMLEIAFYRANQLNKEFQRDIADFDAKLTTIKESKLFHNYYAHNDINAMQNYFLDIAKTSTFIMQLRLIDMNGDEIVRIDRESDRSSPYIVPSSELQNKRHRYYFKEIASLPRNRFWYSNLDINVEHNKIQYPIVPVLRIGSPYYFNKTKDAILIINIFMKNFLYNIEKIPMFDVYLIDKDASIILSPKEEEDFSKYVGHDKFILPFAAEIDKILASKHYKGKNCYATKLSLNNNENITMVLVPKKTYLSAEEKKSFGQIFYVVLAIILLSFPLSYFMSIVPVRLNRKVDKLNRALKKEQNEQDLLLSLFDLSDSVLLKWKNNDEWSVNFVSKSVKKLLGYSKEEFESSKISYSACIHPEDLESVMKEVEEAMKLQKFFFEHAPYRVITKDGEVKWILDNTVVVRNEEGIITDFLAYLTDITDLKEKEVTLEKIAKTDALTQVYNRVYIDEVLLNQYYRYYRNHEECSVIMIDIDYFKKINDEYGHLVGDKVLIEFANVLQHSIRLGDVLGRWGGEEFLLILPHTKIEDAHILAQKVHDVIQTHQFPVVGKITASFGIASFRYKATVEDVVEEADKALYEAKKAGRNCIRVYKA